MLNIVIFGAPGSGKGTQSERIVEKLKTAQSWVKQLKATLIRDS